MRSGRKRGRGRSEGAAEHLGVDGSRPGRDHPESLEAAASPLDGERKRRQRGRSCAGAAGQGEIRFIGGQTFHAARLCRHHRHRLYAGHGERDGYFGNDDCLMGNTNLIELTEGGRRASPHPKRRCVERAILSATGIWLAMRWAASASEKSTGLQPAQLRAREAPTHQTAENICSSSHSKSSGIMTAKKCVGWVRARSSRSRCQTDRMAGWVISFNFARSSGSAKTSLPKTLRSIDWSGCRMDDPKASTTFFQVSVSGQREPRARFGPCQ